MSVPRPITVNSIDMAAFSIEQLSSEQVIDGGFESGVEVMRFRVAATPDTVRRGSQRGIRSGDPLRWNEGGADNIYSVESTETSGRWVDVFARRSN